MSEYPLSFVVPLSLLSILVMITNIGVCVLVYKIKTMRTHTNGFVVSLAISDILTGIALFIQYNADLQYQSRVALNIVYALVLFCGVLNLCAVTFDRYIAVMKPFKYQTIINKFFKLIIPIIWIFSLGIALLPALAWKGKIDLLVNKIYIVFTLIVCAIVPFFFIMYAHFRIFATVRKCVKKERELSFSSQVPGDCVRESRRQARKLSSEAKVAKVFALAALMFILSWFPVLFYTGAAIMGKSSFVPEVLINISPFTLALGSLVNPILYSFMKPDFRRALKKICERQYLRNVSFRSHRSSNAASFAEVEVNGHIITEGNNNDSYNLLRQGTPYRCGRHSNGKPCTTEAARVHQSIETTV